MAEPEPGRDDAPVLREISCVVLVLIGERGAGAHDLVRMVRQGPIYSDFAESQFYAEPKRLARLGLLSARREPGRTRERTVYHLTDAGREALREWMHGPARFTRMQLEPAWRLLATDIVGQQLTLESLRGLRAEIADHRARIDVGMAVAPSLPHRSRYLVLNHRLALRLLDAHSQWLDEVETELRSGRPAPRAATRLPE